MLMLFLGRLHKQIVGGAEQQLKSYALSCVKPGYQYLIDTFSSTLKEALQTFKAARLFYPHKVREINPSASSIDCLSIIPFLQSSISVLKNNELPVYLAKAEDIFTFFSIGMVANTCQ